MFIVTIFENTRTNALILILRKALQSSNLECVHSGERSFFFFTHLVSWMYWLSVDRLTYVEMALKININT